MRRLLTIVFMMAAGAAALLADFTYQETTKITGGALVSAMKVVGVLSKQARQATEPIESTVSVKGDRMVHRNPNHLTIIDLNSQTITSVDMQRKTYSVMTFEQMKQMMQQMAEKMKQKDNSQMNFKVSAKTTGQSKSINGFDAKEMVLTMEMEGSDQNSGQKGSMVITADTWIAPGVPGYQEVRNFQRRMAEKINWTPGGNMFAARPDVAQGMAEVQKEAAKLDGMVVSQTTTMGAQAVVPPDSSQQQTGGQQPAAQQPQQTQQQPAERPSLGGILGRRIPFGGKKSQPQQDQQQQNAPPAGGGGGSAAGVLLEMTTEMNNFSASPVDPSQFEIPAGFKKVEPDYRRAQQ